MNIQELKEKSSEKLINEAENLGIENASTLRRQEIYFAILKKLAEKGEEITGGGVLQYPIDLDTDIQDYFEIQIFKYRAAKQLPRINVETENTVSGIYSRSNRRGLRQNLRLQDLQSTIQLPIPNSVKDQNAVGWGGGEMSGVAGTLLGPVTEALFGQAGTTEKQDKDL